MSHLNDTQRQTIDQLLTERASELQARVRDAKAEAADRPSAQGPQVEDVGEEGEQRFRVGMEHLELLRDQEELTAVADARTRLAKGEKGDYGTCIDCGRDISFERLSAQPTATRCVVCQDAYEKRHGTALRYSS